MGFDYGKYTGGDFVKFEEIGDNVVGLIKDIREGKDFNGNPCPLLVLELDDGTEQTLTAGQVMLKAALAEKAPQLGDRIRIVYSDVSEAKPGKAPAKVFTVDVKTGEAPKATASAAATDPF